MGPCIPKVGDLQSKLGKHKRESTTSLNEYDMKTCLDPKLLYNLEFLHGHQLHAEPAANQTKTISRSIFSFKITIHFTLPSEGFRVLQK